MKPAIKKKTFESLNVCVVAGVIYGEPQWRELTAGGSVTTFDLKVRNENGKAAVVRVSWMNAPASTLENFGEGDEVLVCGQMRSYWAGRLVVDMSCTSMVPLRLAGRVRKNIGAAMATLQTACP